MKNEKTAFLFPGQGAQYVGMGKEFYDHYEEARIIYERASNILGFDVSKLCFESDEDTLKQTKNTQVAIFVTEMAISKVLEKENIKAAYSAGLSLGEYSSLCYLDIIDFNQAVLLVKKRAEYMNDYMEPGKYKMAAVIGLDEETVEKICKQTPGFIIPVNYNCPGQIVVSGEEDIIEKVAEKFLEAGSRKVIKLNLDSAFHTEKLNKAKEMLFSDLEKVKYSIQPGKVYKNVDGTPYMQEDNISKILADHIVSPVYFRKCIENMIADGIDTFIEVGPGKTLSGFVKKINKDVNSYNIDKKEDLDQYKLYFK